MKKVCVIGCGYIGLPMVAMFAKSGCDVIGVDREKKVVDAINAGRVLIEEPGLAEIIRDVASGGKLRASIVPEQADVFVIAVPTPHKPDDNYNCDLSYVLDAVNSIIPYISKGNAVIIESTIAPRSMNDYIAPCFEKAGLVIGSDVFLAHCPERVLPGNILYELENNNKIIGGITSKCAEVAAGIYKIFVKGEILTTEAKTAEMVKCMENTFRDVNIALANELARICDRLEINCLDVISLANKHPRVNILSPGPGVGGHCLAIDPYFIYAQAPDIAKIIHLSRDTNKAMPQFVVDKVKYLLSGITDPKIVALGTAYKGNTDDTRESPALEVVKLLREEGYIVTIHDNHVKPNEILSLEDAAIDADLLLVLTDHDEYKGSSVHNVTHKMRNPIIFDTRNIIDPYKDAVIYNFGNINSLKQ